MAPANTSMARGSAVSLRDIVSASKAIEPRKQLYMQLHQCQLAHLMSLFRKVHLSPICSFARLSPGWEPPREVVQGDSRFWELYGQRYGRTGTGPTTTPHGSLAPPSPNPVSIPHHLHA